MANEIKQREWREAATGGLILGLAMAAVTLWSFYTTNGSAMQMIAGVLPAFLITILSFSYSRKISYLYADEGYTIWQSMGFIIRMMMFAGVILGFGLFLILKVFDTGQYAEAIRQSLSVTQMPEGEIDRFMQVFSVMLRNPVVMVIGGVFSMMFYGVIIGFIISLFVKRAPKS